MKQLDYQSTQLTYHQLWNANVIFLKQGMIMFGSQPLRLAMTFILVNVPMIVFYVIIATNLTSIEFIIYLTLNILVTIQQLNTVITDPGIITKCIINFEQSPEMFQIPQLKTFSIYPKSSKLLLILNSHSYQSAYCITCNINRPARASHCYECNNCVIDLDHHCPWLGQCIGARNYKHYYQFIILTFILIILVIINSIRYLINKPTGIMINSSDILIILLCIYLIPCLVFIGYLSIYHTYLISTSQLTKEQRNKVWDIPSGNPYIRSFKHKITQLFRNRPAFVNFAITYYRFMNASPPYSAHNNNNHQTIPIKPDIEPYQKKVNVEMSILSDTINLQQHTLKYQ